MSTYNINNTATGEREIRISRDFDAPVEVVFDAFTDPAKIGKWWGPDGFSTTTKSMEFKIGGDWIFTMHGPDGTDYPNHIVYTDIRKPEYLKYDHYGYRDGEEDPPHFKQTITFVQLEGKTRVTLRLQFPSAKARKEAADFGAIEGGHQTLGRLADYLPGA